MYGTVMRFDPSKYKPYKMYGKEVYYAISGAQEKKIIDARKQYDVENNSELPDDVTVEAYRATYIMLNQNWVQPLINMNLF